MAELLVPGKPNIEKPIDPERLAKLQAKLQAKLLEYMGRTIRFAGVRGNVCEATYKAFVLGMLLLASNGGKISQAEVEAIIRVEVAKEPMAFKESYHIIFFKKAWEVIYSYVHDPNFPILLK